MNDAGIGEDETGREEGGTRGRILKILKIWKKCNFVVKFVLRCVECCMNGMIETFSRRGQYMRKDFAKVVPATRKKKFKKLTHPTKLFSDIVVHIEFY